MDVINVWHPRTAFLGHPFSEYFINRIDIWNLYGWIIINAVGSTCLFACSISSSALCLLFILRLLFLFSFWYLFSLVETVFVLFIVIDANFKLTQILQIQLSRKNVNKEFPALYEDTTELNWWRISTFRSTLSRKVFTSAPQCSPVLTKWTPIPKR